MPPFAQMALGSILGMGLVYLLHKYGRCEYCGGKIKFLTLRKFPYCKKCGRTPSEADIHT
jgi:hypothetical protein